MKRATLVAMVLFMLLPLSAMAKHGAPKETSYTKASRIVRALFPKQTAAAALRVVNCETGGTYSEWSYNPSGASGYFQILTGNAGRILYYRWPNGRYEQLTIRGYEKLPNGRIVNRLFNPWYNTKVALFLSKGGTDWHEWSCQP